VQQESIEMGKLLVTVTYGWTIYLYMVITDYCKRYLLPTIVDNFYLLS